MGIVSDQEHVTYVHSDYLSAKFTKDGEINIWKSKRFVHLTKEEAVAVLKFFAEQYLPVVHLLDGRPL